MVELFPEAVDPVVAVQAGCAERPEMILGKGSVHLTVAGLASVRSESRDIPLVAV